MRYSRSGHSLRYDIVADGGAEHAFSVAGLPVVAGTAGRRYAPKLEIRAGQPVDAASGHRAGGRQPAGGYLLAAQRPERRAAGGDGRRGAAVLVGQLRHLRQTAGADGGGHHAAPGRSL